MTVECQQMLVCPICENESAKFDPLPAVFLEEAAKNGFSHPPEMWETINYESYSCPRCGCSDRERLYALFLRIRVRQMNLTSKLKMLDFAPSRIFKLFITKLGCFDYRSADLLIDGVDDKVNIENMSQYPDNSFDCFICSHILEHVTHDNLALAELFRVLRPGGFGIIMSPISLFHEHTYENWSAVSEAERWGAFGQGDHVRIYAKNDFRDLIRRSGFHLQQYGFSFFGEKLYTMCGITPTSLLYVGEKSE